MISAREIDLCRKFVAFCDEIRAAKVVFGYGQWDCNTFTLAWLDHLAGTAWLGRVQGQYACEETARAFCAGFGRSLHGLLLEAGAHRVPGGVRFAQAGDFLLVRDRVEPWHRGHVCAGATFASVWPSRGFDLRPMRHMPADAVVLRYC